MTIRRSGFSVLAGSALLAGAALLLTSCAPGAADAGADSAPPGSALAALTPEPPTGEVLGQGTVLDDGSSAKLCLGAVAESAPPQCAGIPLAGWSWEGVADAAVMSGSTWGTYAVWGTYDGDTLTVTRAPVPLALFDAMPLPDPTRGEPGTATAADIDTVQSIVPDAIGAAYLGSYDQDGWIHVDVIWDDGTWQRAADQDFGAGKVIVRSALRLVE
ncbi:hypothetical protein [Microbacterium oleivorans]|uniref:hypothetical protein n=1 Tax=Microbacterium oleivorans TaxID=273677 RepID=UPI00203C61DD|nr:hypothetical protein [Microbacterium oleivorans]MCM3696568.1 hypothetical protein [Microbacterium oleivorans]